VIASGAMIAAGSARIILIDPGKVRTPASAAAPTRPARVAITPRGMRCQGYRSRLTTRASATRHAYYRPSRRSTFFRLLPTFLTVFFTAAAQRPVFFAS
jgi:hypothetical protein